MQLTELINSLEKKLTERGDMEVRIMRDTEDSDELTEDCIVLCEDKRRKIPKWIELY